MVKHVLAPGCARLKTPGRRFGLFLAACLLGGLGPHSAFAGPFIYTSNGNPKFTVTVIDGSDNTIKTNIDLGSFASGIAATKDGRLAYVVTAIGAGLQTINTNLQIIDTDPKSPTFNQQLGKPILLGHFTRFDTRVAVSPNGRLVYITGFPGPAVVYDTMNHTVGSVPVADSDGVAFSPDSLRAYISNVDDNALSIVDTGTGLQIAAVPVGSFPGPLAVTPDGKVVVVTNFSSNTVSIVSAASASVVASVVVDPGPRAICTTPDGKFAYVASVIPHATNGVVSKVDIDAASPTFGKVIGLPVLVGFQPIGIAITGDGKSAYVTNAGDSTVSVLDTATNAIVRTILVPGNPNDVSISETITCQVSVQRFGQCDSPWGGTQYAFHNDGAPTNMCHLGCSTSTLSMGLEASGVLSIPIAGSGLQSTNPGILNKFMVQQGQDVDYDADNLVRWDVTTRDISRATYFYVGKLLFFDNSLTGHTSTTDLKNAVCQGHPVVVAVAPVKNCQVKSGPPGGHFILVTGDRNNSDGSVSFLINDPGCTTDPRFNTLDVYGNQFVIRGFVSDPPSDISGLDLDVGDNADLLLSDPAGNLTGFDPITGNVVREIAGSSYFQDFLTDNFTGDLATGITHSIQILRPLQQSYNVQIAGLKLGTYTLSGAGFSQDGSSQPRFSMPGIAAPGSTSTFNIQFSATPGAITQVTKVVSFQNTLSDISNSFALGLVDNQGVSNALTSKINAASNAAARGDNKTARNILSAFLSQVNDQTGKHINGIAPEVFLADANSLLSELP